MILQRKHNFNLKQGFVAIMTKDINNDYRINGNKLVCIFLALYILFLASSISNFGYSVSLGGLVLALLYIRKKAYRQFVRPNLYLVGIVLVFVGLLLVSAIIKGDSASVNETGRYIGWTIPFFVTYVSCLAMHDERPFFWGNWGSLIILSGYAAQQWFSHPGMRVTSFFTQPNIFIIMLEWGIPFLWASLIYWKKRQCNFILALGIMALILSVSAALFTQSRGGIAGILSGFIAILILGWVERAKTKFFVRRAICSTLILVICGICVAYVSMNNFNRSYDHERVLLVESSYQMWEDNKLVGVGFDNWQREYKNKYISPEAKEPNLTMPHNVIAFFFSTTGIIGGFGYFVFIFGTWGYLLWAIHKHPNNPYLKAMLWGSIAIFVQGLVDSGITNKFAMRLFFGWLGVTLASLHFTNNNTESKTE